MVPSALITPCGPQWIWKSYTYAHNRMRLTSRTGPNLRSARLGPEDEAAWGEIKNE